MRRFLAILGWGAVLVGATVVSLVNAYSGLTEGWGSDPLKFAGGIFFAVAAFGYVLLIGALADRAADR